jgi:hypothetical protein
MNVRRSRLRAAMTAGAMLLGMAMTLSACSGDDGRGSSDKPSAVASQDQAGESGRSSKSDDPLAEVRGDDDITLTVTSAVREDGGFVTVSGTLTNGGDKLWLRPSWSGDESQLRAKNGASMAGANLVDKKGRKRYLILRDTEGRCLCTVFRSGLQPGETTNWYTQFPAPPKNHDKVDFQIADMPPATITLSQK